MNTKLFLAAGVAALSCAAWSAGAERTPATPAASVTKVVPYFAKKVKTFQTDTGSTEGPLLEFAQFPAELIRKSSDDARYLVKVIVDGHDQNLWVLKKDMKTLGNEINAQEMCLTMSQGLPSYGATRNANTGCTPGARSPGR